MSREILGVFMKAPVPGKCKTRLCPPLTPAEAALLYGAFCHDVLELAEKTRKEMRILYDPSPEFPTPPWAGAHRTLLQKGNTLGERLHEAFHRLFSDGYSRVVIIGSDAPTLSPDLIREAFDALNQHDAVFGPTPDGGYYLIGLSTPNPRFFEDIPWSTDRVMDVTKQRVDELKISAGYLPAQSDIDTGEDVTRLRAHLQKAPPALAPATRRALSQLPNPTRSV